MKTQMSVKLVIVALLILMNLPMMAFCGVSGTPEALTFKENNVDNSTLDSSNAAWRVSNDWRTLSSRDEGFPGSAERFPRSNANKDGSEFVVVVPNKKLAQFETAGDAMLSVPIAYYSDSGKWMLSGEADVRHFGNSSRGVVIFWLGIFFMIIGGICSISVLIWKTMR
jgi:hypothetical protein